MKTNQNMIRRMGAFEVTQRTKDEMFNATSLLKQWNKSIGAKEREGKRIDDFLNLQGTKEFLEVLSNDINNTENPRYLKPYTSTRGKNGGTWMHPYLFIDFAMWLNPTFKLDVIKFVYDQLINSRHKAGDNYRELSGTGRMIPNYNFPQVARALNYIVFNKHGKNLRQKASQEELEEMAKIESDMSLLITMGYIKTFDELISKLRELYSNKHMKNPI